MTAVPRGRRRAAHPAPQDEGPSLNARIALVATVVAGQLWGVMVALDAWLARDQVAVWWVLAFQALSFAIALLVWLASRRPRP